MPPTQDAQPSRPASPMTTRQRFWAVMQHQPVDRLPVIEWATWWDKTIERWHNDGLPADLTDRYALYDYFGLDMYKQAWYSPRSPRYPEAVRLNGPVTDLASYERVRRHLYPRDAVNLAELERWAGPQQRGEIVVWISLEGFFWHPRALLGIERHFYAFYDQPDLIHRMNTDLVAFHLHVLEQVGSVLRPDFMTFAEDMSYNHGPMCSRQTFEAFLAPYYRQVVPQIKQMGTIPFVDTDGLINELVPWFLQVGIEGFLPLERQAGVDIVALRKEYPRLKMIGGFDKMVMTRGREAMRAEFERIMPVMIQGGYIPSCDHQTPPGVSLQEYRTYLSLLNEYAWRAAAAMRDQAL